ncbi:hypothetical protein Q5425_07385 [Amycolatopsis sp. A133]|uniref:hypothetical protein n=1 Tax=Amycolatopsis sp. A133 TaxID=3064472 RepID=UPI0027E9DF4F|nr:hypothetical protein [Amycolatopsis sp. A133]MDQ7803547.1 hypothetical protein [Amycolatopsis sp. A133]
MTCTRRGLLTGAAALAAAALLPAATAAPGGICLAYANSLDEEFTDYPGNPVIGNSAKTPSPGWPVPRTASTSPTRRKSS